MRIINFNAGPAGLPLPALERAQQELIDFKGSGMSVMEHSHRGKEYEAVHNEAIDRHGPCPEHRFSYVNVARRALGDARVPVRTLVRLAAGENDDQPGVDAPDAEPVNDLLEQR